MYTAIINKCELNQYCVLYLVSTTLDILYIIIKKCCKEEKSATPT